MSGALLSEARHLVAEAAAWRLAALLLERPRPGWQEEIRRLAAEVRDSQLASCAKNARRASEEKYHRIFGPAGAVSPREVSYAGFEDPGRVFAQLSAYYRAFAFEPRREEPLDHLSVEAAFVGYLLLKEAYCLMREDSESAAIATDARRRFVDEHLQRLAAGVSERLGEAPRYLRDAALWMVQWTEPSVLEAR